MRLGGPAYVHVLLSFVTGPVLAVTLDAGEGLQVTFSDQSGGITSVVQNGASVPLLPGQWGGLAIKAGRRSGPSTLLQLDFSYDHASWASASNANWNTGAYAAWQADGGVDDSGHLLLGNGSTAGTGMALAELLPVTVGERIRISWQGRVSDVATLQILCVRAYDADGTDITAAAPAPVGWFYSSTSQAHTIAGIQCSSADIWHRFEYDYRLPPAAASVRISIRYWNGGDGWVHLDDLAVNMPGAILWEELMPVAGPLQHAPNGFSQSVDVPGADLRAETLVTAANGKLEVGITLQDTTTPAEDRPVLVYWIIPVAAEGWQWWDDLDVSRTVAAGSVYRNTHDIAGHAVGWYPYAAVSQARSAVALGVPMSETLVQRFECDASVGLYSVWEIGLSPLTTKLGSGRAGFSCCLYGTDAAWGFRSATARYHRLYPQFFVKRTTAEGCWVWPVHPSQVPNPLDFGWVYHEAYPIDDPAERALCEQLGIGIYHYVEPWLFWDYWGLMPAKPSYEQRVDRINAWASAPASYASWQASGGINDTGHLLLGDGATVGAGMATPQLAVAGGSTIRISWQAKVADTATLQILGVRVYDAAGMDITPITPPPSGFGYSGTSENHYIAGISNISADAWQQFVYDYAVAPTASSVRVSVRHWNGGDHWVHIDELKIEDVNASAVYLDWHFEADQGDWVAAVNADWENPESTWKRESRNIAAQAVLNCSPWDAQGRYFLDLHPYIANMSDSGSYSQGWPVNSDPDLPEPNTYQLQLERWVRFRLDEADGLYIDSVTTGSGLGNWENRRPDHLAVSDFPLTFSWQDGGAAQLAPQAHEEFLQPVGEEMHAQGKLMMLNLFPEAIRFHAHQGDVQGSEVSQLVESASRSRVRRALAGRRVVTNLLQYNWDVLPYASSAEVEEYIRGQLFWGFFPGISSIGGPRTGGAPDRYFLHPELYERDRPLFQHYIPVIRLLGKAGWEPIPYATCAPAAERERFGNLDRGGVYITVRGPGSAAYTGELNLDLGGCGLPKPELPVFVRDAFTSVEQLVTRAGLALTVPVSIESGDVKVLHVLATVGPDLDGDGDVDAIDFDIFAACQSGPANAHSGEPQCFRADLDNDGDVDVTDFGIFQRCYSPPASLIDFNCMQ